MRVNITLTTLSIISGLCLSAAGWLWTASSLSTSINARLAQLEEHVQRLENSNNEAKASRELLIRIEAKQEATAKQLLDIASQVSINTRTISELQQSRFSTREANMLAKAITADIKLQFAPLFGDVLTLKRDIRNIQNRVDKLEQQ